MYCRVISATGMSRMSRFWRRIRYSNRSSGPSKASRMTSSASGGMYRSCGIFSSGMPRTIASGISCWRAAAAGSGSPGAWVKPMWFIRMRPLRSCHAVVVGRVVMPSSDSLSGTVAVAAAGSICFQSSTGTKPCRSISMDGPVQSTMLVGPSGQSPASSIRSTWRNSASATDSAS